MKGRSTAKTHVSSLASNSGIFTSYFQTQSFQTGDESTEVKEKDIYMMRCMRNHKHQPHLGYHILNHLKAVVEDKKNNHMVMVGGIVTLLAYYHQISLGGEKHAYRLPRLNINFLVNNNHIRTTFNTLTCDINYTLMIGKGMSLHLGTDKGSFKWGYESKSDEQMKRDHAT